MNFELILFDWGGTLSQVVRQEESLRRGVEEAVRIACGGVSSPTCEEIARLVLAAEKGAAADPDLREADLRRVFADWAEGQPGRLDLARVDDAIDAIGRAWIGSLDPLPGSRDTLAQLKGRGCRIGVVSNCMIPPRYCEQEFARQGFAGLADFLVFSSGVGYRKPSPRIYEAALERGFPGGRPRDLSRVLFVGDSPAFDVAAPGAMGMRTALVRCYKGIWSPEDYERARPDWRIDSVAELPALLER